MAVCIVAASLSTYGMPVVSAKEMLQTQTYVNPLYAGVIDENNINQPVEGYTTYAEPVFETDEEILKEEIKQAMMERCENVTFYYETKEQLSNDFLMAWIDDICEHTGEPTEGDYINWHYAAVSYSGSYNRFSDGRIQYTIDAAFTYYTTAEQEAEVTEKVEALIEELGITDNTSDYDKVKLVYDYVCENVTYDYENLDDPDYTLKFSAYAALIHKTAICQGYGTLMYRILNEVDVDTRFVAGFDDNGVDHGWNLVEVDGSYYYIDATWDAGSEEYEYFLKGESDFVDHTPTSEFLDSYDIAESEYVKGEEVIVLPFTDVEEDKWYYEFVVWAYENDVADGIKQADGTYIFQPNANCTRAQFVQFLWNIAGTEVSEDVENPFTDIEEDKWYYAAVMWAVENGVTYGFEQADGTYIFQPNATCTRAQAAQFIYNLLGEDVVIEDVENPFTDIEDDKWYYNAVLWGTQEGIIAGIEQSDGTFKYAPDDNVTRAQVVTMISCAYEDAPVEGIALTETEMDLVRGESIQLEYVLNPTYAANKEVKWTSSDKTVAKVSSLGVVTAIGYGPVTITATTEDGGYVATCVVNVIDPKLNVKISFSSVWVTEDGAQVQGIAVKAEADGGSEVYEEYQMKVFKGEELVAEAASNELVVTPFEAGTSYTAQVTVVDSHGNEAKAEKTLNL